MKKYSVNTSTFILEKRKVNKNITENYTKKKYEEQKKNDLIYRELDKISLQIMKNLFD
jgi:hypothetical protein